MRIRGEAVQAMEAEHGERTQRGYAIEREGNENREKLNALVMEIDRAIARRRTNEERCAELDARSAGAQAEVGSTEEQLARLQQELEANRGILESANADVALAQEELQQRQQEASLAAATTLMEVERQQELRRSCDPASGFGSVVGAQSHHAGGGAHCRARPRGAAPGGRNQQRESATRELWRTARTAWA